METKIKEILSEIQPDYIFSDEKNFIDEGYLDSFDIVTLVSELENTFSIIISAMDIIPENFVSINSICALVKKSRKVEKR
ncbi:MAG: acyl carrier protein [Desulfovibrio sp.]|nr:acyl carrier protein [Desulfovibrio sp.]